MNRWKMKMRVQFLDNKARRRSKLAWEHTAAIALEIRLPTVLNGARERAGNPGSAADAMLEGAREIHLSSESVHGAPRHGKLPRLRVELLRLGKASHRWEIRKIMHYLFGAARQGCRPGRLKVGFGTLGTMECCLEIIHCGIGLSSKPTEAPAPLTPKQCQSLFSFLRRLEAPHSFISLRVL